MALPKIYCKGVVFLNNPSNIRITPASQLKVRNMPFLMAYKPLEMLFLPVLFSGCFCVADLWVFFRIPADLPVLSNFFQVFLLGALAAPLIGFWAISQHGSFVFSANNQGIYYRKIEDKSQMVFIDWEHIHSFKINETGKRTVVVKTLLNKYHKDQLPLPCNGTTFFLESGTICLEFNTSFAYKTKNMLTKLKELKRQHSLNQIAIFNLERI